MQTRPESGGLVVALGGGVNSTAMLVGLQERGIRPDAILFADTGAERPATYEHIGALESWLSGVGFPPVTVIQATQRGVPFTIEQNCLEKKILPSIAYGYKKCSLRFKGQPQDKEVQRLAKAHGWDTVTRLVGIDAGEWHRVRFPVHPLWHYEYPLVNWGWRRRECIEAIKRAGLVVPPKSSCFFCPNMKRGEILSLPCDLKRRAIAIERNAAPTLTTVKGLGRTWAWADLLDADAAQVDMFPDPDRQICDCYDTAED